MTALLASDGLPGRLPPGEVHVWIARLDTIGRHWPEWEQVLSAEERAKADRFVRPEDRHRSGASRAILRRLLGHYLSLPPAEVRFTYNRFGKPSLDRTRHSSQLALSVAHSGECAVFGLRGRGLVGVDLEWLVPGTSIDDLVSEICTARERQRMEILPEAKRRQAFFRCWTLKEAYLKALGVGLALSPQQVETELEAWSDARERTGHRLGVRGHWTAWGFAHGTDYTVAVVASGVASLEVREWNGEASIERVQSVRT